MFGHDVDTNIYNFQFEEFESQEIDSILSKIGEFHQSNSPKSTRDAPKRVKSQPQRSNATKKQKTDDKSVLKDVTNITVKNDTAGVTNDDEIQVVTKQKP